MFIEWMPCGMLQANCTILADEGRKEAIVFDCGGEADKISKLLSKKKLKLVTIILTHLHFDHILGVPDLLKTWPDAKVWAHEGDKSLGATVPLQMGLFGLSPPAGWMEIAVDHWITHDEELKLGDAIGKVIHTPGHSPGSCCFYFAAEELCISGDTLFSGGVGRSDLPGGNGAQLTQSIKERLFKLPENTRVITGHGDETTIGDEIVSNPYVGSRGGMFSAFGGL